MGHKTAQCETCSCDYHYLGDDPGVCRKCDEARGRIYEYVTVSDYTKAWEDDIMAVGNADQVGGLKDILSRTHEADKPGVTQMALSVMGDGPLKTCPKCQRPFRFLMDETTCWRCSGATTASFPVAEEMVRRLCRGTADGIALTSASHLGNSGAIPVADHLTDDHAFSSGSVEQGEMDGETGKQEWRTPRPNECAPAVDAKPGSLHWVETDLRRGASNGDVPMEREPYQQRAVWRWLGDRWLHDGMQPYPSSAYLTGWRYLGPAEYVADTFGREFARERDESLAKLARAQPDPVESSWRRNLVWHLRNDHAHSGLIQYAADRIEELEAATRVSGSCHCPAAAGEACPMTASDCYERAHCGLAASPEKAINTHLRLAAPVNDEMIAAGDAWLAEEGGGLQWPPVAIADFYRSMHAVAPVALVSEAEDRVVALERELDEALDKVVKAQQSLITRNFELIDRNKAHLATLADNASMRALVQKYLRERDAAQRNFDTLCRVNDSLRVRLATEQPTDIDYNGPVKDGRTIPDPAHEQFHRAVGDVLAGKIIPAARRQMEDALGRAPKDPTAAPDAILRGNKAPMGIVERKT